MRKSSNDLQSELIADKKIFGRYGELESMVAEIVARVEPNGYAEALEALRQEWQPVGQEIHFVKLMAEITVRIRGCAYLQTEILNNNVRVSSVVDGPKLLNKLLRYENWLADHFTFAIRTMNRQAKKRTIEEARLSAQLARQKPCTSVIQ